MLSENARRWSGTKWCLTRSRRRWPPRVEARGSRLQRGSRAKAEGCSEAFKSPSVAASPHRSHDCCITTPVDDEARSPFASCALRFARDAPELARHLPNRIRNAKAGWSSCFEYPTHIPSAGMSWFSSRATMTRDSKSALADSGLGRDIAALVESDLAAE